MWIGTVNLMKYLLVCSLKIWAEWTEHLKVMDNGQSKYSIMNPPSFDEYKRIVLTVACAVTNPSTHAVFVRNYPRVTSSIVVLPWDVERFVDKLRTMTVTSEEAFEKEMTRLSGYFKKQNLGERKDPCSLVDRHGRVLVWHLPHIFSRDRLVTPKANSNPQQMMTCFRIITMTQSLKSEIYLKLATILLRRGDSQDFLIISRYLEGE